MVRRINIKRVEAAVSYIRTLPGPEQKAVVRRLSPKKKLSKEEKKVMEILKSIASGLSEIEEAKRTGKRMKTLDEFLDEFNGQS